MWRHVGLTLASVLWLGTMAWGQGPKDPAKPPGKPAGGKEPPRLAPEHRPPIEHRSRFGRIVGWPYWFGYPVIYGDPLGFPLAPGGAMYPYDFAFQNPLLEPPQPPQQPPILPMPRNDPPPEPRPPAKPREEPKARDELERRADVQKFVRMGNEAFAQGDYTKAGRLYQQAAETAPLEPMGFFHLAQAQLAQGKYAEAGVSIQRGLMLQPDWPNSPFDPRALYGEMPGSYDKHLAKLADLVAKNRNDEGLLFLLGYELWFDGKRVEARVLFQRASGLTLNALHVERFLRIKVDP